jgi:hypothetical protein
MKIIQQHNIKWGAGSQWACPLRKESDMIHENDIKDKEFNYPLEQLAAKIKCVGDLLIAEDLDIGFQGHGPVGMSAILCEAYDDLETIRETLYPEVDEEVEAFKEDNREMLKTLMDNPDKLRIAEQICGLGEKEPDSQTETKPSSDKLDGETLGDVVMNLEYIREKFNFIHEVLWGAGADIAEPEAFCEMMRGFMRDLISHYNEIVKDLERRFDGITLQTIKD